MEEGSRPAWATACSSWNRPLMVLLYSSPFLLSGGLKSFKSTVFPKFLAGLPGLNAVDLWSVCSPLKLHTYA